MKTLQFHEVGKETGEIDVRISYKIIQLFSEGLYSSPNKAIEELVSNSFDAGASNVHVLLAADLTTADATIAVIDDGDGMDQDGLRQHWLIGVSDKRRKNRTIPKGRPQIGRFGIGKLATYVLSKRLTHVTKQKGKFFSTSIDYTLIPGGDDGGIYTEKKVVLPLRALTIEQARMAVKPWIEGDKPGFSALKLFGSGAAKSWTVAVMSNLKDMATTVHRGKLNFVLSTAMPLRDDFKLFLNGSPILPSKLEAKRVNSWVLGKTLKALPKPAPNEEDMEPTEKNDEPIDSVHRFGLTHRNGLGRVTGYVEAFVDPLTGGKSDELGGRSHGFFVYVRGRLINADDEHFGIDRNLLRHGTLNRIRAVVHIDSLDAELRSSREAIREGVLFNQAKNLLQGIFNFARSVIEKHDDGEDEGVWTAKRIAGTPTSLTRLPILGMVELALRGKCSPRYTSYPQGLKPKEREIFVEKLRLQAQDSEGYVSDVRIVELSQDLGIAVLDIETGILQINALHPFVAYFLDEYEEKHRSRPLKLLATSEVLMEAHLYSQGLEEGTVRDTMARRDQVLRYLALDSGKRSARMIAQALMDAATDEAALEKELVASFLSMGYNAVPLGGNGKPDGVAQASLPAKDGLPQGYAVSLEAKSKEKSGAIVSNAAVRVSTIARHRGDYECDHALVVGPDFSTKTGDDAALIQEIKENKAQTGKTITLVRVNDLARLVRLQPLKRLNHQQLRQFFQQCITPDESKAWIDKIAATKREKPVFKDLLEIIAEEIQEQPGSAVDYGAVRSALRRSRGIKMEHQDVVELCRVLARLAPEYVTALENAVELTQRPDKVLEAIGAAIRDYPEDEQI